jgi:hypothetical protein
MTLRQTLIALVAVACVAAFAPTQDLAAQETAPTGDWAGVLTAPNGMEIELIFKVVEGEDGALSTTIDVPTQGAAGIACAETTTEGAELHISGCEIPGSGGFDGALNEEGVMAGDFNQAGQSFPLDLKLADESE